MQESRRKHDRCLLIPWDTTSPVYLGSPLLLPLACIAASINFCRKGHLGPQRWRYGEQGGYKGAGPTEGTCVSVSVGLPLQVVLRVSSGHALGLAVVVGVWLQVRDSVLLAPRTEGTAVRVPVRVPLSDEVPVESDTVSKLFVCDGVPEIVLGMGTKRCGER